MWHIKYNKYNTNTKSVKVVTMYKETAATTTAWLMCLQRLIGTLNIVHIMGCIILSAFSVRIYLNKFRISNNNKNNVCDSGIQRLLLLTVLHNVADSINPFNVTQTPTLYVFYQKCKKDENKNNSVVVHLVFELLSIYVVFEECFFCSACVYSLCMSSFSLFSYFSCSCRLWCGIYSFTNLE